MTDIFAGFLAHLQDAWLPHYLPMVACALVFGLILARVTRRAVLFTVQMLLLFLALVLASAGADSLQSPDISRALAHLATLVLGMTLIRQGGLTLFRLVVPKLGLRPPRILEELLILLAYVAWILLRLSAGGLDLGSLVASTAVITAILAFAMQDTLGNILSGLALQLDHSIHIGDWISVEDIAGCVVEVQWRHTAVRTLYGEMILIPNSLLMKSRVMLTGGTSVPRRLRTVLFYCSFDVSPTDVIDAVQTTLASADSAGVAMEPAPVCVITNFIDGVVEYGVRYWLTDPQAPGAADSLIRQHLHALFLRKQWRMASPSRDVLLSSGARKQRPELLNEEAARRVKVLRDLPLFSPLTSQELHRLATRMQAAPYIAGTLITRQHDIGDCLYILVKGEVDVWLEEDGRRHLLTTLESIQIMGEMSLLTGEPRSATLIARSNSLCYVLNQDSFQQTLQNRPELADAFAQLLAERSQERTRFREEMDKRPAAQQKDAILTRIRQMFGLTRS